MSPKEQKTILIVDDEETLTWSMSKNLSLNKEYKVICANSGEEALEILKKTGEINLIVSDIKMQGKDGIQLLSEVKALYPKTAFVIMTAYGSNEKRQEALGKGAVRYLEKPFMMEQVKEAIHDVLKNMDHLFQPVDNRLKEKIKNYQELYQLLLEKCRRVPELINIKLSATDAECLLEVGNSTLVENFKIIHAAKVITRIQTISKKINAGQPKEIIISNEKYNIILIYLEENPLFLYLVFDQAVVLGKAILTARQLKNEFQELIP